MNELKIDYGDDGEGPLSYRDDVDQINELDLDFGSDGIEGEEDSEVLEHER